jgi:hypothetical protein
MASNTSYIYNEENDEDECDYEDPYDLIGKNGKNKTLKDNRLLVKNKQTTTNNDYEQALLKREQEKQRKLKIEEGKKKRALELEQRILNKTTCNHQSNESNSKENITNPLLSISIISQSECVNESECVDDWESIQ